MTGYAGWRDYKPLSTNRPTNAASMSEIRRITQENSTAATSTTGKRPSKYHAERTTVDNIVFDSKKEAARYGELKLLHQAGQIQFLQVHRAMPLCAWQLGAPIELGTYVADFTYCTHMDSAPCMWCVVEDVKSPATRKIALYRWKKKHVAAQYGIEIKEV